MSETPDSLGANLLLEDRIPLRWNAYAMAETERVTLAQGNEETLRVILSLDEHHAEPLEENELGPELARIEMRLNLVLELVSQVLTRQLELPPAVPVKLSAQAAHWPAAASLTAGAGVLELYVCTRYPRPLQFPAQLVLLAGGEAEARFDDLGAATQEQLERLIFRHHRRRIAASRRTPG